ncbi:Type I Iterative PKS [Cytospora paraplurivora]|uniref:Type I Iterative PKS n=1 Tax=Cytospora paraplurivora TaxID=2898453 RepID=A0AAN9U802_9PEZI
MELAYEALENGGITCESISDTATSVYTASFTADFERQLDKDPLDVPTYYATGTGKALLSNRLSHMLNLRGPSLTLDTACSGGLTGLHQACQSLQTRESDTAIVAAVNLILGPDQAIGLSNLRMISSTGRSYPFDDRGSGYGRGEGAVVLILKRLDDAIRDRDRVRAVIRASGAGQDGYTPQTITYPNGRAQAALIRSTYARCDLRPEDTLYIEAHGTGTVAGDTEELSGIAEVFAGTTQTNRSSPLYVGSMKGAIGHTECVSGLASLLKATAMFDHNMIPPVAGFAKPKPGLPLDHIAIPTETIPWPQTPKLIPRISINSFGFGGANAHVILERYAPDLTLPEIDEVTSPRLFTLSANSMTSLRAMVQAHIDWVSQWQGEDVPLADLSYTLLHRRTAYPYRFSAVAHDRASLLDQLYRGLAAPSSNMSPNDTDIIFVFTGQGAQWAGMGRELLLDTMTPSSIFRSSILRSRDTLYSLGATWDLETELLRLGADSRLDEAEIAQPATTAIQIALVALLRAQGVRPRAVVGHSSGEIAAAHTAGYLSPESAITLAYHRGFMASAVRAKGLGRGAMLSVGLGEQDVTVRFLNGLTKGKAVIACVNSPRSVTVSGDAEAVHEVAERIAAADEDIFHRRLLVDTAYHSHHMHAVADEYRDRISEVAEGTVVLAGDGIDIRFVSSVTGQPRTSDFDAEYWVSNLTSPVRFSDAVSTLGRIHHRPGVRPFWVEIGPHPSLSGPIRQSSVFNQQTGGLPKVSMEYQAPLRRKVDAISSTLALAGKLFENGIRINWDAVSTLAPGADIALVRHDLPAYKWDHSTKHWHQSRVARAYLHRDEPYHDLLGVPIPSATALEPRWRHFISLTTLPWLAHHIVDGQIIFPGTGYICMAIEGIMQLARLRSPQHSMETVAIRNASFKRALVVPETQRVELQLTLKPQYDSEFCFDFTVTAISDDGKWYEHAVGVVEGLWAEDGSKSETGAALWEQPLQIQCPLGIENVLHDDLYSQLNAVGNTYGPTFAGIKSITMAADSSQAVSSLKVQDIRTSMPANYQRPHVVHPTTLDTILHTSLPLAGRRLGRGSIMPVQIGELLISVTPLLKKPGSALDVSTLILSTHYRTAISDITVIASGFRVIYATGIELKSLASRKVEERGQALDFNPREICYELDWHTDIEHMRTQDWLENSSLSGVLAQISAKRHGLSIIGLGAGVDLSEEVVHGVQSHNDNEVMVYDFVDVSPGRFEDAASRLKQFTVHCRMLRPGMNPGSRGFEIGSYDLVLATSAKWLEQAAQLVKPSGTILLVFSAHGLEGADCLPRTPVALEKQAAFQDTRGRSIVVARIRSSDSQLPRKIRLLTHSSCASHPVWVASVQNGLRARGAEVSLETLRPENLEPLMSSQGKDYLASEESSKDVLVVIDDELSPIISDAQAFPAAITLLTRPTRVVWLSPDDPSAFHQIEGVARTAHAENQSLRLTTIHAATSLLKNNDSHGRLIDIIASVVSNLANPELAHTEREYRIRESGLVTVPRLHRSDRLNQAIAENGDLILDSKTQSHRFKNSQQPLKMSPDGSGLFVFDDQVHRIPLADDEIEVETRSIVVSKSDGSGSPTPGQYTGVVARVGASVTCLVPGDRVVALAPVMGASQLRIPHTNAFRLPADIDVDMVPANTAAALLLDMIAATYALRTVARIHSSPGAILVHGARTAAGRAVIAVARSIGVRVTATAADAAGARLLSSQLGIDRADILITRRSLHRALVAHILPLGLDAIILAEDGYFTSLAETLKVLKPFGSVVAIGHLPPVKGTGLGTLTLPPNVAIHSVDIAGLLQARPDMVAALVADSTAALRHVSLSGLDIPVHDIADSETAVRLVNTGVHHKVVLEARYHSHVQVLLDSERLNVKQWTDENATFVVAGGLGDIGLRLLSQMAQRGAKHVATISRHTLDPEARYKLLERLRAIRPGFHLYTLKGDITSEPSIQEAAAELSSSGAPPVRGIIQAAIVLIERPLELMTFQDFTTVTEPKVQGTEILHRVFRSSDLNFILCLSSFAGINGAAALGSYNAGNTVQDALAHADHHAVTSVHQEGSPLRFLTVNFGWTDDVSYTANDDKRQSALRRAGFTPIRGEELERFFQYVLGAVMDVESPSRQLRQAIIGADAQSLAGATAPNSNVRAAMFSHISKARPRGEPAGGGGGKNVVEADQRNFAQILEDGDLNAVVEFVSRAMTAQLARLIDVDVAAINVRQGSILDLGLDSLVAVELRNWVMKQFNARLQSSEILVEQTLWTLAERIVVRSTGLKVSSDPPVDVRVDETLGAPAAQLVDPSVSLPDVTPPFDNYGALDPVSVVGAFEAARSATDEYIANGKLNSYSAQWMLKSDEVSIAIFCNALEELGCPIRSAVSGSKLPRIAHISAHEKLIGHMYAQLEKRNLIKIIDGSVIRTDLSCPSEDIGTALDQLLKERPGQEAEIILMRLMGSNYGRCLAGKADAVQLLFGDPDTRELLARSYSSSELNSVLLKQFADFVETVARSWPDKEAPLRILEVGAGTGGTTSSLLPMLARLDIPVIYTITDIGPVFVKELSSTFEQFPFVRYKVLDIGQEPELALRNSQHIVLGTNVIHATRDVVQSLKNIHSLLRPDGFVVIGEMTTQMLWTDVIFGLLAGFWCFEDGRQHATQSAQAWEESLRLAGYGHVDWTQGRSPEAALQALILALAS